MTPQYMTASDTGKAVIIIEELRNIVIKASLNHDVWRVYWKDRTKYINTLNDDKYLMFFRTSLHAHFVACIIALYSLYETRDDTHNIPNFLKYLKEKNFCANTLQEMERLNEQARLVWCKVSIIRNEVFGHRSNELKIEEAFRKAKMKYEDCETLLNLTKEILNKLSKKIYRNVDSFSLQATQATCNVLESLQSKK